MSLLKEPDHDLFHLKVELTVFIHLLLVSRNISCLLDVECDREGISNQGTIYSLSKLKLDLELSRVGRGLAFHS